MSNSCSESTRSVKSYHQPSLTHSDISSVQSSVPLPDFCDFMQEQSLSSCSASIASELQPALDDTQETECSLATRKSSSRVQFVEPTVVRSSSNHRLTGMKKKLAQHRTQAGGPAHVPILSLEDVTNETDAIDFPRVPHRTFPTKARQYEQWNVNTLDLAFEDLMTLKAQSKQPTPPTLGPSIRIVPSRNVRAAVPEQNALGLEVESVLRPAITLSASHNSLNSPPQDPKSNSDGTDVMSSLQLRSSDSISLSSQHSSLRDLEPREMLQCVKAKPIQCGLEAELSDPEEICSDHRWTGSSHEVRAEDLPPLLSTHYMHSKEFLDVDPSECARLARLPERRLAVPEARPSRRLADRLLRKKKQTTLVLPNYSYEPCSVLRAEAAFLHNDTLKSSRRSDRRVSQGSGSLRSSVSSSSQLSLDQTVFPLRSQSHKSPSRP